MYHEASSDAMSLVGRDILIWDILAVEMRQCASKIRGMVRHLSSSVQTSRKLLVIQVLEVNREDRKISVAGAWSFLSTSHR